MKYDSTQQQIESYLHRSAVMAAEKIRRSSKNECCEGARSRYHLARKTAIGLGVDTTNADSIIADAQSKKATLTGRLTVGWAV